MCEIVHQGEQVLNVRKGIILAGGIGSRLFPLTKIVSKHLLPVYDKPMLFYPLSVLMLAGVREILLVTNEEDRSKFKELLGDGAHWGISLTYATQTKPDGIGAAFILAEKFLNGSASIMILGDNIFFGRGLSDLLKISSKKMDNATIFGYNVADPERYGVIEFSERGEPHKVVEKPKLAPSNCVATGLYFFDSSACDRAKTINRSQNGEIEITPLLNMYLEDNLLDVKMLGRGFAWFDTGTYSSLLDASNFVRTLTDRQGLQVGSPDEVALKMKWIDEKIIAERAVRIGENPYGRFLRNLIK